ncbi:MAG: hypothetical protein A3I11_00085 [Elusimicrobia bacterium RIFCSPLOWO2_02_FULL_39_32]|nr:MAG: hypothetical protein A3B80_04515 [Elusimicrobia bacterium RIFCSPHIGHO2_02_FULL_39_36]OGR93304.1 MAG: hypothetical protein A3I11_00085 [Elusimicrobia bacterium RIFCSPLOWO2_02_FULL_39_32]OGS00534.1 MAG: hypothetical protein A3G85_00485 [Elusimicrobia bacterium RIFCSPLOWO2_12_FULL_39_28]
MKIKFEVWERLWVSFSFLLICLPGCALHLEEAVRGEESQPKMATKEAVQTQTSFQNYESLHFKIRGTHYEKMVLTANLCEELYGKIMFDTNLLSFKPRENYLLTIYPTREEYHLKTGYPEWSGGVTITQNLGQILPEEKEQRQRIAIATFEEMAQAPLLAHELSHLIFNEFMGFTRPEDLKTVLWVNEGFASYEELAAYEKEEKEEYLKIITLQLKQNLTSMEQIIETIPMQEKLQWIGVYDYKGKTFVYSNIDLWYWQVRSIVSFLIEKGGNYNFFLFLNSLRGNKDLNKALADAYPGKWKSQAELELEWKNILIQNLP